MSNGDPIIIKGGGSIEVHLSKDTFPSASPTAMRHYCAERHITRVTLTDDSLDTTEELSLPEGGKFTITIYHEIEA